MYLKQLPASTLVVWLLFSASVRAQDNPMNDPDLQQLLKQAHEMQKSAKNPGSLDTRKKLADMEAMAKQEATRQAHAGENSGKLASGGSRGEQSQSEP